MSKPYLIIFAGCNGSGKSTYSKSFVNSIEPFDYDKKFLEVYSSLQQIDIRESMAHNIVIKEFESSIKRAFSNGDNFCYETNFDNTPLYWAQKAKSLGYRIELHFYCLDTLELAKKRVANRIQFNGHYVNNSIVDHKWREGYKNLNLHFDFFDYTLLIDNSSSEQPVKNLFAINKKSNGEYSVDYFSDGIPKYAKRRFPRIYEVLMVNN